MLQSNLAFGSTQYSFNAASATGKNGPTQAQVNTAYTGTNLAGLVTTTSSGIQKFAVPTTGDYTFEIAGAKGGNNNNYVGGSGAIFSTNTISLTQGEVLQIGVGQIGVITSDGTGAGGGGASWVYRESSSTLLAIAAGGGGAGAFATGANSTAQNSSSGSGQGGYANTTQQANGGTSGNGGINTTNICGLGGAGWLGNGTASASCARAGSAAAISINSTAIGGTPDSNSGANAVGGFGGAGAGAGSCGYGGGGGGYSGGGGGSYAAGCGGSGGAGGSYSNIGFNWIGTNAAVGYVKINNVTVITANFNSYSLAGSATSASFRTSVTINASVDVSSKVTFKAGNVVISGCKNVLATGSGSTFTASCLWKPSKRGNVVLTAMATPSAGGNSGTAIPINVTVVNRVGSR